MRLKSMAPGLIELMFKDLKSSWEHPIFIEGICKQMKKLISHHRVSPGLKRLHNSAHKQIC